MVKREKMVTSRSKAHSSFQSLASTIRSSKADKFQNHVLSFRALVHQTHYGILQSTEKALRAEFLSRLKSSLTP